jgi:hypothetical protein
MARLSLFAGLLVSLSSHAAQANQPSPVPLSATTSGWLSAQAGPATFATFFDSGRLPGQNLFQFELPPDIESAIDRNAKSWQPIRFEQSACTFWVPLGFISNKTVPLDSSLGSIQFQTTSVDTQQGRYVVAVSNQLPEALLQQPAVILRAIQDRVVASDQSVGADALFGSASEAIISLQGLYPGRELTWQNGTETIRVRAYLVGAQAYVLGVRYPTEQPPTSQIEAFFKGLKLQSSKS